MTKRLTSAAVAFARGSRALTVSGGLPSTWGSVSESRAEIPPLLPFARRTSTEAVVLSGLDEHLDAGKLDAPEPLGQAHGHLGRDPAGAPVGDPARAVHGAEVSARGDVAGAKVEFDAERLEHAAAHLELEWIVAEESEVPGPAARGDPGRDVADEAAGGLGGELRQIGQMRGLELRAARLGSRKPPSPSSETRTIFVVFEMTSGAITSSIAGLTHPSRDSRSARDR